MGSALFPLTIDIVDRGDGPDFRKLGPFFSHFPTNRPFAADRKKRMFSDSVDDANASTVTCTMVERAKEYDPTICYCIIFL